MPLNLLPAAIGLAGGAVAGLVGSLIVVPLITGRPPTLKGVVAMTTGFAVGGLITGLTLGLGAEAGFAAGAASTQVALTAAAGTFGGAAGSGAQQIAQNLGDGRPALEGTGEAVAVGAVSGLVGGGMTGGVLVRGTSSLVRTGAALTTGGGLGAGSGQATSNVLNDRPVLENVPQATATGSVLALGVGSTLPLVRLALPAKAPVVVEPDHYVILDSRGRQQWVPARTTVPVADFPQAPGSRWVRVGDRWMLRNFTEDLQDVRSDPHTWTAWGWGVYGRNNAAALNAKIAAEEAAVRAYMAARDAAPPPPKPESKGLLGALNGPSSTPSSTR